MSKRLTMALVVGVLATAMLPATTAAEEEYRFGQCIKADEVGTNAEGGQVHVGKNPRGEELQFWTLPGQAARGIENPNSNGQGPAVGLILISCEVSD